MRKKSYFCPLIEENYKMVLEKKVREQIIALVNREVVPAVGCTDLWPWLCVQRRQLKI